MGKGRHRASRPSTARRRPPEVPGSIARDGSRRGAGDGGEPAFANLVRSDPELLRSLVDQAADAVCLHEIGGRILDVNRRMCLTLGYTRAELLARSVFDIDVTATREESARAASRLVPGVPVTAERMLRRKDGSTFPIELSLSLIDSGTHQLLLGMARDITDRKRAEQAQEEAQRALEERVHERTHHLELANRRLEEEIRARQLLLRELDHRVKNTLSTVQAVAELTLRSAASLEDFGATFRGRLAALARMHAAIWRSRGSPLQMRELAELSLAPFGQGSERAAIDGPEVAIPLHAVGALGLVLHELVTNAVRHGALSVSAGRVALTWQCDGGRLCLSWRESGGPAVVSPTVRGFGSTLIQQSVPYELGGSVSLDFLPAGVECAIAIPLADPRTQGTIGT